MAMAMGCMVRIQMSMEHPLNLKNLYNMEDAWYILPCYAKNSYSKSVFSIVMSSPKLLELDSEYGLQQLFRLFVECFFWVSPDTSVIFDRTKDRKGQFLPKPWHGFQGTFDLQYRSKT